MVRLVTFGTVAGVALMTGGYATAAAAQSSETDPPSAIEVSANIGVVSDYRYRGISLSDRDPAIQGGIDITHESGIFAGAWASSIADTGGSNMELDLYAGYGGQAAGVDYSVTFLGYVYPGGHGVDYYELQGKLGKTIGPATMDVQLAWIPDQGNYPGDNIYVSAGAKVAVPDTPLTLHARAGRESSDFIRKWDWEAGASYNFERFTASLSYIDSDQGGIAESGRLARATVVASLLAEF